jgi:hypothetical protein
MPSIITATELRSVLGVSSALYNDAYLNQIIDTAETVILPMLVTFKAPIQESVADRVMSPHFTTLGIHEFTEGQSVVITGCGTPYNGTRTILADNLGQYTFSAAITNADINRRNVIPIRNLLLYLEHQLMLETQLFNQPSTQFQSNVFPSKTFQRRTNRRSRFYSNSVQNGQITFQYLCRIVRQLYGHRKHGSLNA